MANTAAISIYLAFYRKMILPVLAGQRLPRGEVGPAADPQRVLLDVDHLVVAHVLGPR